MRFCSKRCLEGRDWLLPRVTGMQELSGRTKKSSVWNVMALTPFLKKEIYLRL